MASLDFPSNPVNGQTYALNGVTYYYNSAIGAWLTQLSAMNITSSSNTQVLFNDANVANGSSGLTFSKSANTVSMNSFSVVSNTVIGNMLATGTVAGSSSNMFRNKIINGDMRIDQRYAGASVTNPATTYTVDRWGSSQSVSSKISYQQNAGSVTPPAGFSNYLGITSLSSYTPGATEHFGCYQPIEGVNIVDLAWGTSSAKSVTLSFWVRSSLTGTFGGTINNSTFGRNYPFSYTISSSNTWEQKTITIPGDTTGTWLTTTGVGMYLFMWLAAGSTDSGAAGAWSSTSYFGVTGALNFVGTNGATWYITGVQLEVGTVATPFEFRHYGTELALCQRYLPYWSFPSQYTNLNLTFPNSTTTGGSFSMFNTTSTRVPATGITISGASGFSVSDGDSGAALSGLTFHSASTNHIHFNWSTSSGRTAFRPHIVYTNSANTYIYATGCEL